MSGAQSIKIYACAFSYNKGICVFAVSVSGAGTPTHVV